MPLFLIFLSFSLLFSPDFLPPHNFRGVGGERPLHCKFKFPTSPASPILPPVYNMTTFCLLCLFHLTCSLSAFYGCVINLLCFLFGLHSRTIHLTINLTEKLTIAIINSKLQACVKCFDVKIANSFTESKTTKACSSNESLEIRIKTPAEVPHFGGKNSKFSISTRYGY